MAMVPKLIKAALNLHKALPEQVQSQGLALLKGSTGQLLASIKPVRKAKSYELRYGAVGAGGAAPAAWSTLMVPNAKIAVPIKGLTPGTTYAIQVRAYGQLGYTEYSDSVTRMVI